MVQYAWCVRPDKWQIFIFHCTGESFDQFDHDRESNGMPSSEWIHAMENYLNNLIFDMKCGTSRLDALWKSLSHNTIKNTRKEETGRNFTIQK